jgi:hypothetical protein
MNRKTGKDRTRDTAACGRDPARIWPLCRADRVHGVTHDGRHRGQAGRLRSESGEPTGTRCPFHDELFYASPWSLIVLLTKRVKNPYR